MRFCKAGQRQQWRRRESNTGAKAERTGNFLVELAVEALLGVHNGPDTSVGKRIGEDFVAGHVSSVFLVSCGLCFMFYVLCFVFCFCMFYSAMVERVKERGREREKGEEEWNSSH